jgi:adenylosuccinate lyase
MNILSKKIKETGEIGSSFMPHEVNPYRFYLKILKEFGSHR